MSGSDVQFSLDPALVFCLGDDGRVICLCTGTHDISVSVIVENGWDLAVASDVLLAGEAALGDG